MHDDTFEVDADELLRVVERMATCGSRLHDLSDWLARRVEHLHVTWQGEAAEAHGLAHQA